MDGAAGGTIIDYEEATSHDRRGDSTKKLAHRDRCDGEHLRKLGLRVVALTLALCK